MPRKCDVVFHDLKNMIYITFDGALPFPTLKNLIILRMTCMTFRSGLKHDSCPPAVHPQIRIS